MTSPRTRVLIADDHPLLRAGLRRLIADQPDLEVVGEARDAREVTTWPRLGAVDVVLLDLSMAGGGGMVALRGLRRDHPRIQVLVLTMHDDRGHLRAALEAGAAGYVTKLAVDTELLAAIRAVREGRVYVDRHMVRSDEPAQEAREPGVGGARPLSAREQEILGLLARGHTNREIAERLAISVKTVETYRARVLSKLGLATRAELVRYAGAAGLVEVTGAGGRDVR